MLMCAHCLLSCEDLGLTQCVLRVYAQLMSIPVRTGGRSKDKAATSTSDQQATFIGDKFDPQCLYLALDEASMLTEDMFDILNIRLQHALRTRPFARPGLPFGGLSIIIFGDQFQIPAVGRPLLSACVAGEGSGNLLRLFQRADLVADQRCHDSAHTERLRRFRNLDLTQPIVNRDFMEYLQQRYLTPAAVRDSVAGDDIDWNDATVLVGTNALRHRIKEGGAGAAVALSPLPAGDECAVGR